MKKASIVIGIFTLLLLIGCSNKSPESLFDEGLKQMAKIPTEKLLPERCEFEIGLDCNSFKFEDDTISINLENSMGRNITIVSLKLDTYNHSCVKDFDAKLSNGDTIQLVVSGCDFDLLQGNRITKVDMSLEWYQYSPQYPHTTTGQSMVRI